MPNRIIKESITTSEKLASLSDFEFRLWIGLITQADDAGRGDARPAVIRGRIFPFRERLTVKDVGCSLRALADKGCIALYEIDGRPYFYFPNWSKHQRVRDCKPKYPEPTEGSLRQVAAGCGEAQQSAAIIQSNPIQSESESKSKRDSAPAKHAYGEFDNVLLTDAELDKLKVRLIDWAERIERLSQYLKNKPKKHYESHYATILTWAAKDAKEDAERKQAATSRPNRQRDFGNSRAYSAAEIDSLGTDLLGGE